VIPVAPQAEPPTFKVRVADPGAAALADFKAGRITELPALWRACLEDLRGAYRDVCAYAAIYIDPVTGGDSVEHFAPKSDEPDLAYDWRNYRLVCRLLNSRKREFRDVLDPFAIGPGWFELNLPTMRIAPAKGLPDPRRAEVQETIARLKLDDKKCRRARANYYNMYVAGDLRFRALERLSPFVAFEVDRQGVRRAE